MTRQPLTRGEKRLLDWLTRFDFTGKGCYPTRAELAERCGYTEEYVSALVKGLREKDYVTVTKRRRPGCQYAHNVYRVHDWSPNVRRGICNLRRDFVARRAAAEADHFSGSYVERTARPSRAQIPGGNPLLRASKALPARPRAREACCENGLRRFSTMEARRHLAISDLTCPHCQEKQDEVERVREMLRRQSEQQTGLMEEVAGAQAAARATGKALDQVTKELRAQKTYVKSLQTKAGNKVVTDEQVEAIVDHWCWHRPKTRRDESFPEYGKRRKMIEAALKLTASAEGGPVAACKDAIDGLHMAPWETYGKRSREKQGPKSQLKNKLEHALGDETRIERCRDIARWVRGDGADRAYRAWEVARWTEAAFYEVLVEEIDVRRRPVEEPRFEIDGIPVTESGR